MAQYNREKLHELIMEYRELAASIQTFNRLREDSRTAYQRQRALIDKADAKMYKAIESKGLKPLAQMPLSELEQAWRDYHPARTHLAIGVLEEYVEIATDYRQIEAQLEDLRVRFDGISRVVDSCCNFLKEGGIKTPRVRL